mgnify:CR=1 FL=1
MAFWNTKKPQTPPEPDIRTYEAEPPHYEPVEHPPRFRYALSTDGVYRKPALRQDKALISCVGDMLAEEKLYKSHLIGGRTDFHDVFAFVRPYFAASDLTVGNLETMLCAAAPYTGEQYKVDGKYHCNAPQSFLDAVRQAGFDFLMLANNHNLDCGAAGIRETLNRIDDAGLMRTGLFAGPAERRFALVEVVNNHDDALQFEPIHRVLFGVDHKKFMDAFRAAYPNAYEGKGDGHTIEFVWNGESHFITVPDPKVQLAVGTLQNVIDPYLKANGGEVDYIHGDDVTRELGGKPGNMGFLLPAMGKEQLFKTVMADGVLPRKTFSMGHAQDKRYYIEARKIVK